jgi:hypothetical protein
VHGLGIGQRLPDMKGGAWCIDAGEEATIALHGPGRNRHADQLRLLLPNTIGRQTRQMQHEVAAVHVKPHRDARPVMRHPPR